MAIKILQKNEITLAIIYVSNTQSWLSIRITLNFLKHTNAGVAKMTQ